MKILLPTILAAACSLPAAACDLCAVYAVTHAHGESSSGLFGGVAEQFTHYGTLQEDSHKVSNPIDQHIDSSISQLFIGNNFTERVGVQFNLPVIYREFRRPHGPVIENGTQFGIGDASLLGNFAAYRSMHKNSTFIVNLLGGLKFPTGNASHLNEPDVESENGLPDSGIAGHDLALGSGSVDGILGTSIYGRWKHFYLSAGFQYAARTEGDFGHQYANDFTWAGGPGYYIALADDYSIALQALVSGESKGKDTNRGVPDEDSAVTSVFLGPQIDFTWSTRLSAHIGVDLPVSLENTGLQAVPDYRVHAAVTWRF
jgi:hypothetical protein